MKILDWLAYRRLYYFTFANLLCKTSDLCYHRSPPPMYIFRSSYSLLPSEVDPILCFINSLCTIYSVTTENEIKHS